jgi:hypothetical protein
MIEFVPRKPKASQIKVREAFGSLCFVQGLDSTICSKDMRLSP